MQMIYEKLSSLSKHITCLLVHTHSRVNLLSEPLFLFLNFSRATVAAQIGQTVVVMKLEFK